MVQGPSNDGRRRLVEPPDPQECASLAAIEANEEKADALNQQTIGPDQAQMQGYQDRSKYREVVGTGSARRLLLSRTMTVRTRVRTISRFTSADVTPSKF